ncbi:MAG: hypothetical protein IPJ88_16355 [Myxococcales bacterium]|nr:MAG: hypothetical protein IPJ88_16355 [Myxococcales bacterium]
MLSICNEFGTQCTNYKSSPSHLFKVPTNALKETSPENPDLVYVSHRSTLWQKPKKTIESISLLQGKQTLSIPDDFFFHTLLGQQYFQIPAGASAEVVIDAELVGKQAIANLRYDFVRRRVRERFGTALLKDGDRFRLTYRKWFKEPVERFSVDLNVFRVRGHDIKLRIHKARFTTHLQSSPPPAHDRMFFETSIVAKANQNTVKLHIDQKQWNSLATCMTQTKENPPLWQANHCQTEISFELPARFYPKGARLLSSWTVPQDKTIDSITWHLKEGLRDTNLDSCTLDSKHYKDKDPFQCKLDIPVKRTVGQGVLEMHVSLSALTTVSAFQAPELEIVLPSNLFAKREKTKPTR